MIKQKIKDLIPITMKAVETELKDKETGTIKSEYNGYISSLGSGLVQAGLLPTLAFFTNKTERTAAKRYLLLNTIAKTLKIKAMDENLEGDELLKHAIEIVDSNQKNNTNEAFMLKEKIKNAAVAIKLAIRTFPTPQFLETLENQKIKQQ